MASDVAANDFLGNSVKVSDDGSTMVVGAHGEDDKGSAAGAVYIYSWDGSNWTGEEKLTASDGAANDYFGWTVDISEDGNTILVGAYGDDDSHTNSGSVFIYSAVTGEFFEKVLAPDGEAKYYFGRSVCASNSHYMVGASGVDSNTGAAYLFQFSEE